MDRRLVWFCALLAPVLGWSAIAPHDYFTWFLEIAPVFIGLPLALALHRRFPLSSLLLVLLWWHSVILIFGGHYTYARVPLGEWARHWFGWTRNNYDKLGHFAQGFVPAIFVRELLLRTSPLGPASAFAPFGKLRATADKQDNGLAPASRPSRWLGFLVVSVCFAFSALYELIEWLWRGAMARRRTIFLGHKATRGTRRLTWPWRWSGPSWRCWRCRAGMTVRLRSFEAGGDARRGYCQRNKEGRGTGLSFSQPCACAASPALASLSPQRARHII